jgi:hypothetical protein
MFKVTNEEPRGMYLNHGQSWDSTSRTRLLKDHYYPSILIP